MYDKNQPEKEDHTWIMYMQTLRRRMKIKDIEERLPQIIDEYYREQGKPTPPWRQRKPYFDKDGNIIRPD